MDVYTHLYPCTPLLQKQWGLDRDDRALQGSQQAVQDSQDCADRGASTFGLDKELLREQPAIQHLTTLNCPFPKCHASLHAAIHR